MSPSQRVQIVAHRGVAAGSIPENTTLSARLALLSGADIVEVDACATRDGRALAFHDATELENLGTRTNVMTMTGEELDAHPFLVGWAHGAPVRVQGLEEVLHEVLALGGSAHVDRGWTAWEPVLEVVAHLDDERIALKARGDQPESWDMLAARAPRSPVIIICRSHVEVQRARSAPGRLAALELVTDPEHPERAQESGLLDPQLIRSVREQGLDVMVNAENLTGFGPLYGTFDDHRSILEGPDAGWGEMIALGATMIQTDVPWLLARYRDARPS